MKSSPLLWMRAQHLPANVLLALQHYYVHVLLFDLMNNRSSKVSSLYGVNRFILAGYQVALIDALDDPGILSQPMSNPLTPGQHMLLSTLSGNQLAVHTIKRDLASLCAMWNTCTRATFLRQFRKRYPILQLLHNYDGYLMRLMFEMAADTNQPGGTID